MFTWVIYSGHLAKATTSLPESINWPTLKVPLIPPFLKTTSLLYLYKTPGGYFQLISHKRLHSIIGFKHLLFPKWILKLFYFPIQGPTELSPYRAVKTPGKSNPVAKGVADKIMWKPVKLPECAEIQKVLTKKSH